LCPCGVGQPTCLRLMQEITGAKPVRDANSGKGWWSNGFVDYREIAELGSWHQSINPLLHHSISGGLAPTIFDAPKALSAMHSPGTRVLARCNSVWRPHFHSSNAVEPALRQVS